jgi:Anti-sigma-K factor rskA, C-terminal
VNIQDYISSGIIESYVLGLASEAEALEFENLCAQYPELATARNTFEIALEKQCFVDVVSPPLSVKEEFLKMLEQNPSINKTKITTMESSNASGRNTSALRWIAAASILLLLASGYFAYNFYDKNQNLQSELDKSKDDQAKLDERLKKMEDEQKMMSDPNVAVINLVGTQKAPKSSVNVYWDSTSSNVYLVVKNMPQLPSDKQYQLWALINGQPKDLGLFDESGKVILKMKNTQKADAFAITIEKRGHTGGPTLEDLQAMGKTGL